jgi:predicted DNA binding CopG/RHH family protein
MMVLNMKKEYDFTNAKKNPYTAKTKKQITINLNEEVLVYFKNMSEETGIPYQSLINLYLLDCVNNKRTLKFQ